MQGYQFLHMTLKYVVWPTCFLKCKEQKKERSNLYHVRLVYFIVHFEFHVKSMNVYFVLKLTHISYAEPTEQWNKVARNNMQIKFLLFSQRSMMIINCKFKFHRFQSNAYYSKKLSRNIKHIYARISRHCYVAKMLTW